MSRDRTYALTINLEIDNPFKVIELSYEIPQHLYAERVHNKRLGHFRISLPQSSALVQLNQRVKYDGCMTIGYVQLAPSVNYEIECINCDNLERVYLDNIFSKRMSQFDAEFDSIISEKILFGLQVLLNQQRLELGN